MTREEWNDIAAAFNQAHFRTMSDGVRTLALAFVNLPKVRDAIAVWRDADGSVLLGIKPIKQDQGGGVTKRRTNGATSPAGEQSARPRPGKFDSAGPGRMLP